MLSGGLLAFDASWNVLEMEYALQLYIKSDARDLTSLSKPIFWVRAAY